MEDAFPNPDSPENNPRPSGRLIVAGVGAIAVALALAWFVLEVGQGGKNSSTSLPAKSGMTAVEQKYARQITVAGISLSRAENFLHQEVTTMSGEIHNEGSQTVSALRLTTEFTDEMNQTVLRETRAVIGATDAPLAPGERRTFEISYEHVPNSWNMQQPAVRVEFLRLRPQN